MWIDVSGMCSWIDHRAHSQTGAQRDGDFKRHRYPSRIFKVESIKLKNWTHCQDVIKLKTTLEIKNFEVNICIFPPNLSLKKHINDIFVLYWISTCDHFVTYHSWLYAKWPNRTQTQLCVPTRTESKFIGG